MAKKKRSPAQLAADKTRSEKMKQIQAEQKEQAPQLESNDVAALLKRVQELEARQFFNAPQVPAPVVAKAVVTKYSFNPKDYPDPRDQLFEEQRLVLKGFTRDWWDLDWKVNRVNYEEDGQKYAGPRFELNLIRIMEDPETGLPSNKRFIARKCMFFEDPDSFVAIANNHGVEVPEDLYKPFLDEMRYMTARDWVMDFFYPPKPSPKLNEKETVIDNTLVKVYEINSETPETIPFKV